MPRVPKVSVEDAVCVIKNFATYFTTNNLPPYSSKVWIDMSMELNGKWTAHDVYIAVREDRRGIVTRARDELGIIVDNSKSKCASGTEYIDNSNSINDSTINDGSDSADFNNNTCLAPLLEFDLTLAEEEWDAIKPNGTVQYGKREKYILTKSVWTNIISIALWKQHKFPCAFVFKRADVQLTSDESLYSLKIKGSCKSKLCGNKIYLYGEKHIKDNGLHLSVKTCDVRNIFHETVKRPLNGKLRSKVQEDLKTKGCKNWQREQARLYMKDGDIVPPFIPNDAVLRNAKKERNNADLNVQQEDGRDVVRTIENLSLTEEYAGLIHAVGSRPFFIFYSSPAEMNAYKEYCKVKRDKATIILDSTGSLVKKLIRSDGQNSGHIFLYSIVVNFENTTLPVHQMLSETHSTEFITYWLMQWIRAGAPKPKVTVSDYSRALILGLCLAFNNCTIKSYIQTCFEIAVNIYQPICKPQTLIRIDIAHLTHMICRWKCFETVRQTCIKEFFVRCVSLMVDSQSISEFEHIFILTCVVGLQSHEDSEIDVCEVQTPREARKKLEEFISNRNIKIEDFQKCNGDEFDVNKPEKFACESEFNPNEFDQVDSLVAWLQRRKEQATMALHVGQNLNPFYLPDFIERLFNLAKEFPLWTSATIPYDTPHASSSCVEGYFNDLKTRVLRNTPPPLRVDKFIKIHIRDILGQTLLFSSKVITFNQRIRALNEVQTENVYTTNTVSLKQITKQNTSDCNQNPSVENKVVLNMNDSDLMAQENWRGKALNKDIGYAIHSIDESTESSNVVILTSTPIHCTEHNGPANIQSSIVSFEHSYCKSSELNIREDCSTLQHMASNPVSPVEFNLHKEPVLGTNKCTSTSSEIAQSCNNDLKIKKKTKYYELYPEIRQRNLLTVNTRKPYLLLNGGICKLPLKIDGVNIFLKNTCALDSLVHIIMTGALDDPKYADILETSANITLQFIWTLINTGLTKDIYLKRVVLLKNLKYPCIPEVHTNNRILSYSIDALDSIGNIVKKTLDSYPSVYITENCSGCSGRSYSIPYLDPNHKKIEMKGFGALEEALDFRPYIYNVRCQQCKGKLLLQKKLNYHIFIDLDIRSCTRLNIAKNGLQCKLTQLPTTIRLQDQEESWITYRLIGVVTFSFNHFVAHCRRSTGRWELFNDLHPHIAKSNLNKDIEPHLAMYLQQ